MIRFQTYYDLHRGIAWVSRLLERLNYFPKEKNRTKVFCKMVEKSNCHALQTRGRMEKQRKRCYCKNRLSYNQSKKKFKKNIWKITSSRRKYIRRHHFEPVFHNAINEMLLSNYSKVLKQCEKAKQWKNNARNFAHERKFVKLHKYVPFKIQLPLPDFKPWWTR